MTMETIVEIIFLPKKKLRFIVRFSKSRCNTLVIQIEKRSMGIHTFMYRYVSFLFFKRGGIVVFVKKF